MNGRRRILVALDTSAGARAALRRAADMARRMEAELAGLFVEDEDLLRLAGLPFAREFSGGGRRDLSLETMERELAREAVQLERELEAAARSLEIPWSFRTARGRVFSELLAASSGHELMVLGMAGAWPGHVRLGSTARRLLAESGCPVMLIAPGAVAPGAARSGAVLAVFDGSSSSGAALTRARQMREPDQSLEVLLMARDADELAGLREQAFNLLDRDSTVTFHALTGGDGKALADAVLRLAPATLVLGELQQLGPDALERLFARLDGTVLQVREVR